jgi:hypothetical protein
MHIGTDMSMPTKLRYFSVDLRIKNIPQATSFTDVRKFKNPINLALKEHIKSAIHIQVMSI